MPLPPPHTFCSIYILFAPLQPDLRRIEKRRTGLKRTGRKKGLHSGVAIAHLPLEDTIDRPDSCSGWVLPPYLPPSPSSCCLPGFEQDIYACSACLPSSDEEPLLAACLRQNTYLPAPETRTSACCCFCLHTCRTVLVTLPWFLPLLPAAAFTGLFCYYLLELACLAYIYLYAPC